MRLDSAKTSLILSFAEKVSLPGLDCLVIRKRLKYLKRQLAHGLPILLALLAQKTEHGKCMPWTSLIVRDLRLLRERVLTNLYDPVIDWKGWCNVIASPKWEQSVDTLFFTDSVLDSVASPEPVAQLYSCSQCEAAFSSAKAKDQHERIKHGMRNPMRAYVFGDCRCRACNTVYSCRWMLIRHLCDSRRTKCRDLLLASSVEPMSLAEVTALDNSNKVECTKVRRAGHSQIQSTAPATREGTMIGRFSS